jgi:hypothetical protein
MDFFNRFADRIIWRRHLPEFHRRYLLRTNLSAEDPAKLWQFYKLVEIEAPLKNLKDDLQLRPIHHRLNSASRRRPARPTQATGPRPHPEGRAPAIQMLDVHPATHGRALILSRYTELNADQKLLLKQLKHSTS